MAFKFLAVLACVAVASAIEYQHDAYQHGGYHQPLYHQQPALIKSIQPALVKTVQPALLKQVEYEAPAKYDFSYSVHDEHTGDIKQQHESRDGDSVHGSYSLVDSDGHHRVVEYTADAHNGFNAVVRREPTQYKVPVQVQKVIAAPVAHYAAPVAKVAVAAPVAHYQHSAPIAHHYQHSAPIAHHYQQAAPIAHYAAPVAKVVAPVAHYAAPAHHYAATAHHYAPAHDASHVSFQTAAANYHY